jgi:hypothetical protein
MPVVSPFFAFALPLFAIALKQGHPVPLNLLLVRKSDLTLDGITRQLDPDFNAWLETLACASGVFASEAAVRT